MLFAKAVEAGSAVRGAVELAQSAHVHALRYGSPGSPAYKKYHSQHVGRFLSCMREFQRGAAAARVAKAYSPDEQRDAEGRWTGPADVQLGKYKAGGTTGLNREQVIAKVRDMLRHPTGGHIGYAAGKAAALFASSVYAPPEVQDMVDQHVAHATGHLVEKLKSDTQVRRLFAAAIAKGSRIFSKALEPTETMALKGHVARVMADTRLHPRIACDDSALAAVAHGAYRHLHDRLQAQVAAI